MPILGRNSFGGFARSDSTAIVNGNFARAGANSRANAFHNYSRSNARAVDNRSYGQAFPTSGMSSPNSLASPGSSGTGYTNYGPGVGVGGVPAVNNGGVSPANASGSLQTQIITSGRSGNLCSFGSRAATFIRNR